MAKKATAIVPTMLRMREELRKRLEREAKKNDRSLNAEMVGRLEQSFSLDRNSAIIDAITDILVSDSVGSVLLRQIAGQLTKLPKPLRSAADIESFLTSLNFLAYATEVQERIKAGEIPDDQPEGNGR
jgi:hypothetical protein